MPLDAKYFPNASKECANRSPKSRFYNCIAFTAGDATRNWWPNSRMAYWPKDVPEKETVNSFLKLYQNFGYTNCKEGSFENGFEKVAIYALNNKVKHAARQLPNGNWESKLGQNVDIEHETVENLEGPCYGTVVRYLKRQRSS